MVLVPGIYYEHYAKLISENSFEVGTRVWKEKWYNNEVVTVTRWKYMCTIVRLRLYA